MLTPEQLQQRQKGITATDAVAILGISPWKSALDVYLDKTGYERPSGHKKSSHATNLGNIVEDYLVKQIIDYVENGAGVKPVYQANKTVVNDWKIATPDVLGSAGGQAFVGEAKLVGLGKSTDWGEHPPDYVRAQVVWQMIVTGAEHGYICAAVGGTDVRFYEVKAGSEEREALVKLCKDFWDRHVLANNPPPATTIDEARALILSRYPRVTDKSRSATTKEERYANEYFRLSQEIRKLEEDRDKCRFRLMNEMEDFGEIYSDNFVCKSISRKTTSWKDICEEIKVSRDMISRHTKEGERYITLRERGK